MTNKIVQNLAKSRVVAALVALAVGGYGFSAAGENGSIYFHDDPAIEIVYTNAVASQPAGAQGDVVLTFQTGEGSISLPNIFICDILVVGGGGAGGSGACCGSSYSKYKNRGSGGGGGGGGVVEKTGLTLNGAAGPFAVVVGAGGARAEQNTTPEVGQDGGNSSFSGLVGSRLTEDIVAEGGGGGGAESAGRPGGSGGGGSKINTDASTPGGDGTPDQGFEGGVGAAQGGGAGGGGAGGPGMPGSAAGTATGGVGRVSYIYDGTARYYGGGGGGGIRLSSLYFNPGGLGGGGNGCSGFFATEEDQLQTFGVDGLGGGGGGNCNAYQGGKGGDGVVIVRITKALNGPPSKPTPPTGFSYNGANHIAVEPSPAYDVFGVGCATNAGVYQCTVKLREGFEWAEGGTDDVTIDWSIAEKPMSYPASADFTYDGDEKFAFDSLETGIEYVSGTTNETNAANYTYVVKLADDNYVWKDAKTGKEHEPYTVSWVIRPKQIAQPTVPDLVYNGGNQSALSSLDPSWVLADGSVTSATNAGSYSFTISFKDGNYIWEGVEPEEAHESKTFHWFIDSKPVEPPPYEPTLVYNGEYQCPVDLEHFDDESYDFVFGSDEEKLNVGDYKYTLTLNNEYYLNYIWQLGEKTLYDDQIFNWSIVQATNAVTKLEIDGWKVGNAPNEPQWKVLFGEETAQIDYASVRDETWTNEPPSTVGSYWVRVRVEETPNWMEAEARKQFALWDDPKKIFSDSVAISVGNSAGLDFTNYPLIITLSDNNPPGFLYDRAGLDGRDLIFISGDGKKQLPYEIVTWNPAGESTLRVYLDELPKEGTTISLYWSLREGQTTPAQPSLPEDPSEESSKVTFTYGTVERDDKKVDCWSPAPTMTPTVWDEGSSPTITLNPYAVVSGAPVSAGYYDVYHPETTNALDLAAVAALPAGSYLAVFTAQKDADWLPIDYTIQFRVVGHEPSIWLNGTESGRILTMNNDYTHRGTRQNPQANYQGWYDSDESNPLGAKKSDTPTFWQKVDDEDSASWWYWDTKDVKGNDTAYNRKLGTEWKLWTKNYGRRLWHLVNCRQGNTYNNGLKEDYSLKSNQNYLPWSSTSFRITTHSTLSTYTMDNAKPANQQFAGQILMQNTTNACIYSPCYTNGVGTIYFDAVNGWWNRLYDHPESYQIVVEVATATKDGSPLTEESSHVTTNAVGQAVTNDYSNIKAWVPVTMYPVHYKDGTLTPTNATTKFALAVKTGATKSDFYRFYVPINHIPTSEKPGGIRFRIRRAGYDDKIYDYEDGLAYLLVDNVLVSYPPMTATLHDFGWFDPEKKNEQTLGRENVTTVAFPSQYEKEAYGRARSTYYVNDGDPAVDTSRLIVSAKMWYRWRYLNQLGGGAFDSVDLNPGKSDYRSMQPLKFPGGVGDIEYWFETRFQAPYYEFKDYSGCGITAKEFQEATGYTEEVTCTTNRLVTSAKQSSAGKDWYFRLREGKSPYEGLRVVAQSGDGTGELMYVPMELIGDGSWRGFLKTPQPFKYGLRFHIEGLNPQGANMGEFNWSTNYWRATAPIVELPRTTKAERCEEQDFQAMPCDAMTGCILFQFEEETLGVTVARADYQDMNYWSTAVNDKFVGSALEQVYSASTVGESNLNWSVPSWQLSKGVRDNWKEDFRVESGQYTTNYYKMNLPFVSATTHHDWLAENAMWVHGQWLHEAMAKSGGGFDYQPDFKAAVQLEGRGKGRLSFTDGTDYPKGLDTVKTKMRLAQFNEFNDFNFWTKTSVNIDWDKRTLEIEEPEDMQNYTVLAMARLSPTKNGDDYSGDGSISLVGYYTLSDGGYEARFSRGSCDSNARIQLFRWRKNGGKMECTDLGYREVDEQIAYLFSDTTATMGGIFLSVEEVKSGLPSQSMPCTLVQAGLMRAKASTNAGQTSTMGKTQNAMNNKEFMIVAFRDESNERLTHGTFGVLSANCNASVVNFEYGKAIGTDYLPSVKPPKNGMSVNPRKTVLFNTGKFDNGRDTQGYPSDTEWYSFWAQRPGRLERVREDDVVYYYGFKAMQPPASMVVTEVTTHGGSSWTPIATNTVASFLDADFTSVVHSTEDSDIRFLVQGDPNDVRTDVVINNVELSQWRSEDIEGLSTDYGLHRAFAFTSGWIDKKDPSLTDEGPQNRVLSLQPARSRFAENPVSFRTPLLQGIGLVHFGWQNADSHAKVLLQLREAETFEQCRRDLMSRTSDAPDDEAHWTTITNFVFDGSKWALPASGQTTVLINHRAPVSGALRLVLDRSVVERAIKGPESKTNPMYGAIQITDCYVWDLPAYSPRDWSGWNMRATGWNNGDPNAYANLFDSPRGYSGILNNTLDPNTLASKESTHYSLNPPCIQSPTFGTNCIGEVLFKARLYDVPRKGNPAVVTFYGSNDIDDETGEPRSWRQLENDVVIDANTFKTYSVKFKASESFRAVRFAVRGVKGVIGGGKPYFPDADPVRVVIDSLCVLEQAKPQVRFRQLRMRPFRNSQLLKKTEAVPDEMVTSFDEQPILGEAFGFQTELELDINDEGDIQLDTIAVDLYYYQKKEPWGFDNWKDLKDAHRVRLLKASDKDLVFRSGLAHPDSLARPVFQKDVGPVGWTQYHMVVYYRDKSGEQLSHDLSSSEWSMPSWYQGLSDPNKAAGAAFSAFTVLEAVSPGRAWINEINYVEESATASTAKQWLELAVPPNVDMSGWSVYLYSRDMAEASSGASYEGGGPLFKFGKGDCKKVSFMPKDGVSHYAFVSVGAPGSKDVETDGRWNALNGKRITEGALSYSYPFGFELRRPSGIIEHRVVSEGRSEAYSNYYFYAQYTGTNLVRVLNEKIDPKGDPKWVFAGKDPWERGKSPGVFKDHGEDDDDWKVQASTLGLLNEEQFIDPNWMTTPNGEYVWIYLTCANPQVWQIVGNMTNQSDVVTVTTGGGTNIIYEVDNFYEFPAYQPKVVGDCRHVLRELPRENGKNRYDLFIYDVSNRVDVSAEVDVSQQLKNLGVTKDNPYRPAIMNWLAAGVTRDRNGREVPFKGDTIYPFVYRMSDGTETNLSATVAYWLDVDITEPGWELRGAMGDTGHGLPLNPDEPTLLGPAGSVERTHPDTPIVHTNRYCTLWLELTNTVRTTTRAGDIPVAHPPWRLQGLGNERSDDKSTYIGATWTSVTFQVTGRLAAPGTLDPLMKTPRVLRHLVFGPDSFRPADDDVAPFSAWVEVVDPFSSASPASDWGWSKWWNYPVLLHWGLDDDHTTDGASVLRYIDSRNY